MSEPETAVQNGKMRRPDASLSPKRICPECRGEFVPYRWWQTFCSPKCRKANWSREHRTGIPYDIRAELSEIRQALARIELHIKGGS